MDEALRLFATGEYSQRKIAKMTDIDVSTLNEHWLRAVDTDCVDKDSEESSNQVQTFQVRHLLRHFVF